MRHFQPGDPASGIHARAGRQQRHGDEHIPQAEDILALVERLAQAREGRKNFLDADLFAEPGWDMLVQLFHADMVGYRLTISNLAIVSDVPLTTALRWMEALIEKGLAERRKNPLDGRSTFIEITGLARAKMFGYLCRTWTTMYA